MIVGLIITGSILLVGIVSFNIFKKKRKGHAPIIASRLTPGFAQSFLKYFSDTLLKDIAELKIIAAKGETDYTEYIRKLPPIPPLPPGIPPTTHRPPLTHIAHSIEVQPSRCTIPLAMVCISTIEVLGNILDTTGYKGDFSRGMISFFDYTGITVSHQERELLREVYRNGLMHSFFPKGEKIGITYDSSLMPQKKIFLKHGHDIILNVNYLTEIVEKGLTKVTSDASVFTTIENNLSIAESINNPKVPDIIAAYKKKFP